ncbi:MAG: type II secretion system F family protein [Planctomycetota bacterium]|nr:MAG: type II secretion system F family protein [Planctomycetota bacterium]REJ87636.1 MAG: type II secretion system F family protein [Planctomycetota bacterium]REK23056.1 MAG: type II secretion system F family protein [Planctomycetota bacterium]REK34072.1 MAG: type II secretion system F family protein [Planctomycetota bacterium]
MPDFQYIAREISGRQVTGTLAASSQQDALGLLSAQQLFPISVAPAEELKSQWKLSGRRVRARQKAVFYSQLADLLKSGVPLLRSLELLEQQATSPAFAAVLQDVREQVADGTRLHDALRRHQRVFGDLVVSMVRAGEEGGFLEEVLKRTAAFTDHQEDLKGRVLGAMVYPLFLMIFGTGIVVVLLIKFVPKFEPIFERMAERNQLPWATTALLGMSDFAQAYWWLIALALALGAWGLNYAAHTETGRWRLDTIRLRAYGIGRIIGSLAVARFCRVLGTLLRNGVPILQSLGIAKDATGNAVLSKAIADASDNISEGKSLAKPLGASGEFPPEIVEMISVGEEANNLENVLVDIADNLERRTGRELDLAVRLLEPIMLVIMAAVVLFVVVALLLPILQSSTIA